MINPAFQQYFIIQKILLTLVVLKRLDDLLSQINSNRTIDKPTDLANRVVSYAYDGFGNLVNVTDAVGNAHTYTYNSNHGITSKTNPLDETTTVEYRYPSKGVVSRVLDPVGTAAMKLGASTVGHETLITYDFNNKTFYATDKNGRKIMKTVNSKGRVTSETDTATGKVIRKTEFLAGRVERITDEAGNVTTEQTDEWGNLLKRIDPEGNESRYTYTTGNRLASMTHPDGRTDRWEYNAQGKVVKETLAAGGVGELVTTYAYDNYGQFASVTRAGATTSYSYDVAGNLIKITDPLGNATRYEYDATGNRIASIDANGNRSEFSYDATGRLLSAKDPLGGLSAITYNAAGRPASMTDALGRATNIETDFSGRVIATTDALGNRKEYQYDGNGNLTKFTQEGAVTTLAYDSSNRLASITDAEGNVTRYEYATGAACAACGGGSTDSPSKITDPLGNATQFTFDKNERVTGIIDPMSRITNLALDAGGRVTSTTDANGKITKHVYDSLGRVVKDVDANNGETTYTYDARGNLVTVTDAQGNATASVYDLADRVIKETRPMGQTTEYAYYPNGLLKSVKDAKGQTTSFAYDKANRLTTKTYADNSQDTFTYDATSNLITYANANVSGAFTHDALNRNLSETVNYGSFQKTHSYTYDGIGNKLTFASSGGTTYTYTYNKNNQPTSIAFDGKTLGLTYQWNRLMKTTLPNGVTTDYAYNANSWLNYITTKQATTTLQSNLYTLDNVGNVTGKNTEHGNYAYGYDNNYQLTNAANPTAQENFTFDKIGNRITLVVGAQPAVNYTHDANNALINAGTASYTYDANGNTIQETNGALTTNYAYNAANRLEQVTLPDGRIVNYTYDPFGRRIKKTVTPPYQGGAGGGDVVTYYAYSDEGLVGEYDATGNVKKSYGWMPGSMWGTAPVLMVEAGQIYYYHNDHLGTPHKMTDEAGTVVWSAKYSAFGEATVDAVSNVVNNLRFPGQYFDIETGLHYNFQRYYNPKTGRYTQTDPIGFGGGLNTYAYVDSNSLVAVDPLGLAKCTYSISSHTLSCTPNTGGAASALGPGGVFSGLGPCKNKSSCANDKNLGPIQSGNYNINRDDRPGNERHWRLEPTPKVPGWKCYFGLARCGFKLHPGTFSLGCITADTNDPDAMKQYDQLHNLLQSEDGSNALTVSP